MLASVPGNLIRYTLGVTTSEIEAGTGTELAIINDCCRIFENWRGWSWQVAQSQPLDLRLGEPFAKLPTDFREIIEIETNPSLLNNITLTTWSEMLQLRTNSIQSWGGYYRAVPRSEFPETKNLLGFTEAIDNGAWTSSADVTASQATGPNGTAATADEIESTGTATDSSYQEVAAANLVDGRMYTFSVYLKNDDATASQIILRQRGVGGSVTSTESNSATGTITWDASDVPSISGTLQGHGVNQARVTEHGDGWYRLSVSLTWRADGASAATDLSCEILPDTTGGTLGLYAWGAQLEETELKEDPYPTRYEANTGAYSKVVSDPEWRLAIWPTPTSETGIGNFAIVYRKKLPTIAAESDTIPIPDYCEPLFNELARNVARAYHEEDMASLSMRVDALRVSSLYADTVRQDSTTQNTYGRMRGTAAQGGKHYRNWGSWVTVPTPS